MTTKNASDQRGGLPPDESLSAFAAAASGAFGEGRRRRRRSETPDEGSPRPEPETPSAEPTVAAEPAAASVPEQAAPPASEPEVEPEPAVAAEPVAASVPEQAAPPASEPEVEPEPVAAGVAPEVIDEPVEPPVTAQAPAASAVEEAAPAAANDAVAGPTTRSLDNTITQVTVMVRVAVSGAVEKHMKNEAAAGRARPTNTTLLFDALNKAAGRFAEIKQASLRPADAGLLFPGAAPGRRQTHERQTKTQWTFRPTYGELELLDRLLGDHGYANRSEFVDLVLADHLRPLLPK